MKRIILCVVMIVSFCAEGSAIYCTGEITNVYIPSGGDLVVRSSWRNDYTRLCNLKGIVNDIDSVTCSMWGSYVATALKDKKKVTISYDVSNGETCSTVATYGSAPKVRYVMLRNEDVL